MVQIGTDESGRDGMYLYLQNLSFVETQEPCGRGKENQSILILSLVDNRLVSNNVPSANYDYLDRYSSSQLTHNRFVK